MTKATHDFYWSFLNDSSLKQTFYSATDTKKEHAAMQWLFQGVMMHMTLQQQASIDHTNRADFQTEIKGTQYRVYSPIGFYMAEDDYDYFKQSSYIPKPFPEDEWLRHIVSQFIGWVITDDQALMLLHLELIHDNYPFDEMSDEFAHCAKHFSLFLPNKDEIIPALTKPPETVQPYLHLVH
jgi:hypothetical protein|tara:strand:- start:9 stop:551 length:543 start_codon:yes stop_codon:yes gene_type:complete